MAIERPADLAGLRLEHGLVELVLRDAEGEPGALPLLSYALMETWRRRDGNVLTVEGYRESGGIRGAVARSADRLYDSLPSEQRTVLRSLMLRLVAPSIEGDPVRCRVSRSTLRGDARSRPPGRRRPRAPGRARPSRGTTSQIRRRRRPASNTHMLTTPSPSHPKVERQSWSVECHRIRAHLGVPIHIARR